VSGGAHKDGASKKGLVMPQTKKQLQTAARVAAHKARNEGKGLKKVCAWVPVACAPGLRKLAQKLCEVKVKLSKSAPITDRPPRETKK